MKKLSLFIFTLLFCSNIFAQSKTKYHFTFLLKNIKKVELRDSIKLDVFKFYLSNFGFKSPSSKPILVPTFYTLIDFSEDTSFSFTLEAPYIDTFNEIRFDLGIDSNTNTLGVLGGVLDPLQGMYWSWQSGYINIKIEGSSPRCKSRKNKFQFHLGGFLPGQYAVQKMNFNATEKNKFVFEIDLDKIFKEINLKTENSVMIPGQRAIELSKLVSKSITIKQ